MIAFKLLIIVAFGMSLIVPILIKSENSKPSQWL